MERLAEWRSLSTGRKLKRVRGRHQVELDALIEGWTKTRAISEVEQLMIEFGIPAGRVFAPADMLADPHYAAREAIVEIDHPRWRNPKMQNVFPRLSRSPGSIRSIAPQEIGGDNEEVLGSLLGLERSTIEALRAEAII